MRRGSIVEWTSQARGVVSKKIGKVVCRVPADTPAVVYKFVGGIEKKVLNPRLHVTTLFDLTRISVNRRRPNEASYLVVVPQPGAGKDLIYWPRNKDLVTKDGE
jgi:hypothetical protein